MNLFLALDILVKHMTLSFLEQFTIRCLLPLPQAEK